MCGKLPGKLEWIGQKIPWQKKGNVLAKLLMVLHTVLQRKITFRPYFFYSKKKFTLLSNFEKLGFGGVGWRLQSGVTKRCRLFGLTNSVLVCARYRLERKRQNEGGDGYRFGHVQFLLYTVLYSCVHGAQINFDDSTFKNIHFLCSYG